MVSIATTEAAEKSMKHAVGFVSQRAAPLSPNHGNALATPLQYRIPLRPYSGLMMMADS